jgi:hypothetical protein
LEQARDKREAIHIKAVVAHIKEDTPLDKEFVDQNYWKTSHLSDKSVEELMAEMGL